MLDIVVMPFVENFDMMLRFTQRFADLLRVSLLLVVMVAFLMLIRMRRHVGHICLLVCAEAGMG